MQRSIILNCVDAITDLGVVMYSRMLLAEYIDVTAGKAFAVLEFVKRLSREFRDPYTLRTFNVSLVPSFMTAFL
jgi:hypothetical protein